MRRVFASALLLFASFAASLSAAPKTFDIYFIDVEGGQATLLVSPGGQSMLIDTGWPGYSMRDANRIAAAAKAAGVKELDYVVLTHYHTDHAGGVPQLLQKLPVKQFIDHGENREQSKSARELYTAYTQAVDEGKRRHVQPGDTIAMKDLNIKVVSADGENFKSKLEKSALHENSNCAGAVAGDPDPSENARSVGVVVDFGQFRLLDLGDLTWAKEMSLACPDSPLQNVSLYVVTHHGSELSNSPGIVKSLNAKAAVMDNGARKGGASQTFETLHGAIKDVWQLHYAMDAGKQNNSPDPMIANLEEACAGNYIKVSANRDGTFTVYNSRNKYSKSY